MLTILNWIALPCLLVLLFSVIEFAFSHMRMIVIATHLKLLSKEILALGPNQSICRDVSQQIAISADSLADQFLSETWMGRILLWDRKRRQHKKLHEEAARILEGKCDDPKSKS